MSKHYSVVWMSSDRRRRVNDCLNQKQAEDILNLEALPHHQHQADGDRDEDITLLVSDSPIEEISLERVFVDHVDLSQL